MSNFRRYVTSTYDAADHWHRERSPAVTRTRVVKGHSVNLESSPHSSVKVKMSPVPQPTIKTNENPDLQAARESMNSVGGSSNRGSRPTKDFNASTQGSSKRVRVSKSAEDTMTTLARDIRPTYVYANNPEISSLILCSISYKAKLVSPASFMASVRDRSTSQSTSSSSAQQPPYMDEVVSQAASSKTKVSAVAPLKEKPISVGKPSTPVADVAKPRNVTQTPGPDLMDLDLGKEATIQPVLNFTRPQEETAPQATAAAKSDTPVTDLAMHIRALEAAGLSMEQLDMLRALENVVKPKTEVEPTKSTSITAHNKPSHSGKYTAAELVSLRPTASATSTSKVVFTSPTPKSMQQVKPFAVGVTELLPSNPRETRRSLALQLAERRETLIGEHVHRSRFQTHGPLVEGFKKLTISDDVLSDATVSHPESISSDVAPKEPPKVLEVFEYTKDNPFGPAKKKAGLSLPPHLRDQKPAADPGAAVRAQYGLADVPASVSNDLQPKLPTAKAGTPSLPLPLRSESPSDIGATARAQYGGGVVPARTSKVQPRAHVLIESIKPSLPAHLRGQTANDTAAAMATTARANNGDVLAPIHNNGQLRSPTFTGVTTSTTAASQATTRASRFNQLGFLGLAARAREAQKADQDPLKIAASKGF